MTKTERERLQEIACDMCHQPYACANEDELAKACEECPISAEMCEMEEDEPMKQGKWLPIIEANEYGEAYQCGCYCSECGETLQSEPNYCPSCGAKMEVDG